VDFQNHILPARNPQFGWQEFAIRLEKWKAGTAVVDQDSDESQDQGGYEL
jgi:hypothetical protein